MCHFVQAIPLPPHIAIALLLLLFFFCFFFTFSDAWAVGQYLSQRTAHCRIVSAGSEVISISASKFASKFGKRPFMSNVLSLYIGCFVYIVPEKVSQLHSLIRLYVKYRGFFFFFFVWCFFGRACMFSICDIGHCVCYLFVILQMSLS